MLDLESSIPDTNGVLRSDGLVEEKKMILSARRVLCSPLLLVQILDRRGACHNHPKNKKGDLQHKDSGGLTIFRQMKPCACVQITQAQAGTLL